MDQITYARHLAESGCFTKALDTYISAFEKDSRLKHQYEPEFRIVLSRLNEVLELSGRLEDILQNFGYALEVFPNNIYILNDLGKYLYSLKMFGEAWSQFQKALSIDSGYVSAEKNLNSIKNLLVERWHFRMLNDRVRNEAYHNAIKEILIPLKDSVLDIGTGTGLLAMYACKSNPVNVIACDASETMANIAIAVLKENNCDQVKIKNIMSTSLNHKDIGGEKSLAVTELFDAGLFGEHVLETLSHALKYLMQTNARVIPNKAEFFVVGAKCDRLNKKFQLCQSSKDILKISEFFVHINAGEETYDCEDVCSFIDLKYVTKPESVMKVNFNDYHDIQNLLTKYEPFQILLKSIENEEINLLIGWFNLNLTEEITITTDPQNDSRASAWQQSVFFDFVPMQLKENQSMKLNFSLNGGKICLIQNNYDRILRVSSEIIRFLNDKMFTDIITQSIPMSSVYLSQISEMSEVEIVDLCPFPLFGFYLMKREAKSLICYAKTEEDRQFIKYVFKKNNIPLFKVTVLKDEQLNIEYFGDEKYHAIFCNIFELCGDIDIRIKEVTDQLHSANLYPCGLFMPHKITLIGQLIESNWLDINNRVYDDNVGNYKVAMHLNKYQVSQHFNLDLTNLEFKPLSDPHEVGCLEYDTPMTPEVLNISIEDNGNCNAILCWYKIKILEEMGELTTNRGDSFIDGMAFLADPSIFMSKGDIGNIIRCVDTDGSFKFMLDREE